MENKTQFQKDLEAVIEKLSGILIDKNNKYGDSALNPINVFSKLSGKEAIKIRLDDKISRLRNNLDGDTEDPMLDLWGYLTLYQIAEYREQEYEKSRPKGPIDHENLGCIIPSHTNGLAAMEVTDCIDKGNIVDHKDLEGEGAIDNTWTKNVSAYDPIEIYVPDQGQGWTVSTDDKDKVKLEELRELAKRQEAIKTYNAIFPLLNNLSKDEISIQAQKMSEIYSGVGYR